MSVKSEVPVAVLMQYFRVPTGDLVVDYPGRGVLLGSSITNLSTTGVFIRTANPLPKGTELEIVFSLPGSRAKITAQSVVRWSSEVDVADTTMHDLSMPSGMGLEFVKISSKHRKLIHAFVEDFLTRIRKGNT